MRLSVTLTIRAIQRRPLRTILSMLGIMIGVAGILALGITNQGSMASISELFVESSGRIDLMVAPVSSASELDETLLRNTEKVAGVKLVLPLIKEETAIADQNSGDSIELNFLGIDGGGVLLYGVDPEKETLGRDYSITQGQFLSGLNDTYEIVLVETYAEDNSISVGEKIRILTPNGIEELSVVGLMEKRGPGLSNNGSFGIIPIETAQKMFNKLNKFDQLDILLNPTIDNSQTEDIRLALQKRLGDMVSVTYPAGQGERMTQMLSNYQIGLNFLSGIALFVGAFLIYNTFAMTVVERTREFGMLRTIGMTRRQIIGQVLLEAILLGVLGSILGIVLGILSSRGLSQLMGSLIGTDLISKIAIPIQSLLASMIVGVGVTTIAAIIPAIQAGRISPITAIRIRGKSQTGWLADQGWKVGVTLLIVSTCILILNPFPYDPQFVLGSMTVFLMFGGLTLVIAKLVSEWEKLLRPLMKLIYGNSGLIGSRNIERSKSRTTLTVTALIIGVAMRLNVRIMTASFSKDLLAWVNAYLGGDIYVHSSVNLRSDIARLLNGVDGVYAATPIQYYPIDFLQPSGDVETITFMAVDPPSYFQVTNFVFAGTDVNIPKIFNELNDGGGVLISSVMAEKYGFNNGDQLWIRTASGYRSFKVLEVVVDFYNQGLVVTGNRQDLKRYFRTNEISTVLLKINQNYSTGDVMKNIEDIYGKRFQLTLESNESIQASISSLMKTAFSMFDVMAILAVMIASLGIVNTLTMNIIERTQEIGMLRAIGMSRSQVVRMVLSESGIMGLFGGVIGVGFGILLSWIFLMGMAVMSGYKLDFVVPIGGIITGLIVSVVISQVAAIYPANKAARTDILNAIHFE